MSKQNHMFSRLDGCHIIINVSRARTSGGKLMLGNVNGILLMITGSWIIFKLNQGGHKILVQSLEVQKGDPRVT